MYLYISYNISLSVYCSHVIQGSHTDRPKLPYCYLRPSITVHSLTYTFIAFSTILLPIARTTRCRPTLMLRQIKCANGQCSDESKCFVIPTPGQTGDNSPTAINEMTRMSVFSYSQAHHLHQPPLQRPVCSDNDNNGQPSTFPDDYSTMQNYCVQAFQATCAEILIFPANGNPGNCGNACSCSQSKRAGITNEGLISCSNTTCVGIPPADRVIGTCTPQGHNLGGCPCDSS